MSIGSLMSIVITGSIVGQEIYGSLKKITNMEWLNSTPDLTWLQLILISFIGNLCGSLLCTYIDRYEAKKDEKKENDKSES